MRTCGAVAALGRGVIGIHRTDDVRMNTPAASASVNFDVFKGHCQRKIGLRS
jgi:hypothetical protein